MTPVWKIKSGKFAGWYSNDALYDAGGHYLGFLAGTTAYSLSGEYLGEIHEVDWIGRSPGNHAAHPTNHRPGENVAHARLADRAGLGQLGWDDPKY
ncbi:MAG: 4-fold beta flower protein [Candidatus Saccharimonadales bacterium]